jgi:hypothetical protein
MGSAAGGNEPEAINSDRLMLLILYVLLFLRWTYNEKSWSLSQEVIVQMLH